jgi:predicted N-acetyltransferase YhbS
MKILKAKQSDARKISYLRRNTIKKVNSKDYKKTIINYLVKTSSPKEILKRINNRDMFCIWKNGVLLGTVDLKGNKIGGLYVKSNYIGKGIGKKLMEFIEEYAKKKGIRIVKLYPTITAYNFYVKLGYKRVKKTIWKTEDFKILIYELRKRLK